jgi:hypothetical protein
VEPSALAPSATAQPVAAALPPAAVAKEAEPPTAASEEIAGAAPYVDAEDAALMKKRALGYLIVHSTASRASVYINSSRVGPLDEKLSVPCGKRFVAVGITAGRPPKLVWTAPGKMTFIPCGGAFEMTMNPRALR